MQQPTESSEVTFARRMREEREERGLSQAQVSEKLEAVRGIKLDSTAITRIEKGARSIRLNEAMGLAYVLDIPLERLLDPAPSSDLDERIAETRHVLMRREQQAQGAQSEAARVQQQLEGLLAERDRLKSKAMGEAFDAARGIVDDDSQRAALDFIQQYGEPEDLTPEQVGELARVLPTDVFNALVLKLSDDQITGPHDWMKEAERDRG